MAENICVYLLLNTSMNFLVNLSGMALRQHQSMVMGAMMDHGGHLVVPYTCMKV